MKNLAALALTLFVAFSAYSQEYNLVGKFPAPQLQLKSMDGTAINTAELRGKIVVYNLWFVGCPPCREEIPKLNQIVEEYKDKEVVFIGISSSSKKDIEMFVKEVPFSYQIIPNSASQMLGGFGDPAPDGSLRIGFPLHVVVNREGFIEFKVRGIKGVDAVRDSLKKHFPEPAK